MELLRSGEVKDMREVMDVIVREARGVEGDDDAARGDGKGKGKGKGKEGERIQVPKEAIAEATKTVREKLEGRVEIEDEGKDFWEREGI